MQFYYLLFIKIIEGVNLTKHNINKNVVHASVKLTSILSNISSISYKVIM